MHAKINRINNVDDLSYIARKITLIIHVYINIKLTNLVFTIKIELLKFSQDNIYSLCKIRNMEMCMCVCVHICVLTCDTLNILTTKWHGINLNYPVWWACFRLRRQIWINIDSTGFSRNWDTAFLRLDH